MSNAPWPSYVDVLAPHLAKLPGLPSELRDPLLRQETYQWLYAQAAQGIFALVYQDTEYPDFWPVYNQVFNFGFPNPDDSYYLAVVDGDGVYKISGYRGTVRMCEFHVGTNTMMPYGFGPSQRAEDLSPPAGDLDLDQGVHFGSDGAFEVVLSGTRPPGHSGDWWKLDPKATFLLVRQRAYDWLAEEDGRLAIERLDRPAIKPRRSAEDIAMRLGRMGLYMENWTRLMVQFGIRMRDRGLYNKVDIVEQQAGIATQKYLMGIFDLEPDEALILETSLPRQCRYWMFHLTDEMMTSIDPMNRQTSLNGHTATLDSDGKFRAVISAQDPGVPNWLDTAAYARGAIVGRWMHFSDTPLPSLSKVKAASVRAHLPADTRSVSVEERDASIRLRRKGAQLRRRW